MLQKKPPGPLFGGRGRFPIRYVGYAFIAIMFIVLMYLLFGR